MREFRGFAWGWAAVMALTVCATWFGAASIAHGQGVPIVRSIDVQYSGPATVAKERILAQMRTTVGQPYSDSTVEEDIRTLYKTGAVQNVRIFAQPEADGVKVIVAVQTRPVIRELVIDGTRRVSAKKLRKEIAVKLNAPVNEDDLQKGRQKIIDVYQSKGFTDITVDFRTEPIDESKGTARVIYTVNEGARGAVKQIAFSGNEHFSDRLLRKQMKTKRKTMIAFIDKSGRLDEVQFQQDLDKIKDFYQNHGYIDAEVQEVGRERKKGGPLVITIGIKEGTQYHVSKLTFAGYKQTTEDKIRKLIKMKEGSVYSPKDLHDDAKALADAYGSGGYVDLIVQPQGTPAGPGLIDVHYKIEEGNRSFVERINITGNTRTKDKVIRREVLLRPGDVFNTVRVETTKKRLENLGFFSKVDTYPEDIGVEGHKDLVVQVEEKRTGSLNFGAGYSTIDQLIGFVELTQGNFDIANWPGLTGAGQKFRAKVQIGSQRKDFVLALSEPYFLDQRLSLGGQAFFSDATYLSSVYSQRNYGFSLEMRKPLWSWVYGILGYSFQVYDIYNLANNSSPQIQSEAGATVRSAVSAGLVWDRRDNPFLTRRGERISLTPWVAGGPLGGDEQTYGVDFEATKYWRVWKDLIFLVDFEATTVDVWDKAENIVTPAFIPCKIGTTGCGPDGMKQNPNGFFGSVVTAPHKTLFLDSVTGLPCTPGSANCVPQTEPYNVQIPNVPVYDRLYLGGSSNLRGFKFRDISPKDSFNQPIGGLSMWRATGEITFPIIEKARFAVFSDIGVVNPGPWTFGVEAIDVPRGANQIATYRFNKKFAKDHPGTPIPPPLTPRRTFDSLGSDFGVGLRLDLPIGPLRLDYGFPVDTAGNASHGHLNFSVGYQF